MAHNALLTTFRTEGFHLLENWLNACIDHINSNSRNIIFSQLLCTDIVDWGTPCIPNHFNTFHQREWNGCYVLQINEIINLCAATFEDKNVDSAVNPKLLRLKLTDGHTMIHGMVYTHIDGLSLDLSLGSKIVIKNAYVRRGYLILTNSNAIILNGIAGANEEKQSHDDDDHKDNNSNNNNRNAANNTNPNNRQRMEIDDDDQSRNTDRINHNLNRNRNRNANINAARSNNNGNNTNQIRPNISISYDTIPQNQQNMNNNNNNQRNARIPRKLTQKEKLCGFGKQKQESVFIAPNVVREEREQLQRNEDQRDTNMNDAWTCPRCTFDNMNSSNPKCEVCGAKRPAVLEAKKKIVVKQERAHDQDDDIEILSASNHKNKNTNKQKESDIVDVGTMRWEDMTFDDDDIDMSDLFSTTKNVAKKKKKKKKKFF